VQVHVRGDRAHLRAEARNLVRQHAWGWGLDRVVPVVVVVAKRVGKVENGHLADVARILGHVEVGWFHTALGHGVRHKEEVEATVNHLRLFNEALVNIGALGWVVNEGLSVLVRLLEEALAHSLVHDDQGDLGWLELVLLLVLGKAVLILNDLVQLFQFKVDDLLAHGVANTVTVDENMIGHLTLVELAVALERALEVVRQNRARDNFLAFLRLGTGLRVVLAHVLVIGGTEADGALLAFVANVNAHKHGLVRDFWPEGHSPQVATELGVHLSDDVEEDAVIVLGNGTVGHELGDHGRVAVDLILDERVEVLVVRVVWHDNQKDELGLLHLSF